MSVFFCQTVTYYNVVQFPHHLLPYCTSDFYSDSAQCTYTDWIRYQGPTLVLAHKGEAFICHREERLRKQERGKEVAITCRYGRRSKVQQQKHGLLKSYSIKYQYLSMFRKIFRI
jgi:hypothetical protein